MRLVASCRVVSICRADPTLRHALVTNIKLAFRLAKVGKMRVWALVAGTYAKPGSKSPAASEMSDEVQEWDDGDFTLLTIFKN